MVGLADLHNVEAWSAFASHDDDTARYHFARAMTLGNAGDGLPVRELYTSRACQRRSAARVKLMHSVRAPRRLTGRNAYTRTGSVDQRRHGVCAGTDGRTHCRAQSTDQSARGMACASCRRPGGHGLGHCADRDVPRSHRRHRAARVERGRSVERLTIAAKPSSAASPLRSTCRLGTVGEWSWQLGPPTRCASCGPHEPIARASTLLKLGREPKYRDLALIARRTL
jgi:hypothetical protein